MNMGSLAARIEPSPFREDKLRLKKVNGGDF
jgi:hypothetical protein